MISKICVFAASSPGIDQSYLVHGKTMAHIMAKHNITMVYGAGTVGIMGVMADEMLKRKGHVTGVIPRFMHNEGWSHPEVIDLKIVDTMHERKALMMNDVDGIIAMPGGVGTLEELLEAITLKQLGQFLKPIVILNTNGFYDPLIKHLQMMIDQQFMRPLHGKIWQVTENPEAVLEMIKNEPEWNADAIKFAAVEANAGRIRSSGE